MFQWLAAVIVICLVVCGAWSLSRYLNIMEWQAHVNTNPLYSKKIIRYNKGCIYMPDRHFTSHEMEQVNEMYIEWLLDCDKYFQCR